MRNPYRRIVLALSIPAAVSCAILLVLSPTWLDPWRWLAVAGFSGSLVASLFAFVGGSVADRELTPQERGEERMATVRCALLMEKMSVLQASHDKLQGEIESARAERAAAEAVTAAAAARDAQNAAEVERLREELRAREETIAQSQSQISTLAAGESEMAAEIGQLRTAQESMAQSERAARERADAAQKEEANLRAALSALRSSAARLHTLEEENEFLRTRASSFESDNQRFASRMNSMEAQLAASSERANKAEAAVRQLEAARRDLERSHAEELATVRQAADANLQGAGSAPAGQADASAATGAELEALRARVAETEEAVRAALRELGVDASHWPLTAEGVTQAVGPLTLHALGETTPGWNVRAPSDTLAAAVLDLARRASDRRVPMERTVVPVSRRAERH